MKLPQVIVAAALFSGGIAVGYASQKVDTSVYHGKSKADAAKALLEVARVEAGDGSWERIGIGRVYYLGGMKSEGQAIFDGVLSGKHKSSDLFRIAKVYREAGEWPKAKALFDSYVRDNPDDSQEVAQIGAYTLINGDPAGAERLFDQSFNSSVDLWGTIAAAGAYVDVVPQE